MLKQTSAVLSLVLLCGCFDVKDELTLEADGSGTVRIETTTALDPDTVSAGAMGSEVVQYPPVDEDEARKFFPGKEFETKVKREKAGQKTTVTVEAAFKDINALLKSPYGRAHQLAVVQDEKEVTLKAVTGMEGAARLLDIKDDSGMFGAMIPGGADMDKMKNEMRVEFRMTLPGNVTAGNGKRDGKSIVWIEDRRSQTNALELARRLSVVCEARCSAEGVTFKAVTPARLGLLPFNELSLTSGIEAGQGIETNTILNAAKFVPYALKVTRSVDLSGEGGSRESGAALIGAVVIPPEFKPQKWGAPKLTEAVDSKGNNLKLEGTDDLRWSASRYSYSDFSSEEDDEMDEGADKNKKPAEERHSVTLAFRPPEWKVSEIARIRGNVEMQYFSGAQIIKLTNAIPASWIVDRAKMMAGGFGSGERRLSDAALEKAGIGLDLSMGMSQNGMLVLMFGVEAASGALLDAQVFDSQGKAWPTYLQDMSDSAPGDKGKATCTVVVMGQPQPPLSLAFVASGTGTSVEIPIRMDNVPVNAK